MFETSVDRFGRAIAGVGVVEVGQDVPGSAFECPAQRHELGSPHVTRVEVRVLMSACIRALPALVSGAR